MNLYLGCDPGWTNMAYSLVSEKNDIIHMGCVVPKNMAQGSVPDVIENLVRPEDIKGAVMERFVYYDGIHNPHSEHILMVTGQVQRYLYGEHTISARMMKAIDWKNNLSRHLYKKGFRNPSKSLDKKFSIAAAEFIFGVEFETDHEADASCMAYIASMVGKQS